RPSRDPKTDALLRRQAVWALATLGENCRRLEQAPEDVRAKALEALDRVARLPQGASSADFQAVLTTSGESYSAITYTFNASGELAGWARASAGAIRKQAPLGVVAALADCAEDDDPFLRKLTAHALGFWDGTPDENRRIDATLLKLARDDGHGTAIDVTEGG